MSTGLRQIWQFPAVNWTVLTAEFFNRVNWNCREQFYGQKNSLFNIFNIYYYMGVVMDQYMGLLWSNILEFHGAIFGVYMDQYLGFIWTIFGVYMEQYLVFMWINMWCFIWINIWCLYG